MTPSENPTTDELPANGGERQRRARLIRSRRPMRLVLMALAAVTLVSVVAATFVVSQRDVTEVLVEASDAGDIDLQADLRLRSVDPETGELAVRLVVSDPLNRRTESGLVTDGFRIQVNDVGGQTTYPFPEGDPIRAVDFSVGLGDGSVFGYPFDTYQAGILVLARDGTEPDEGRSLKIDTAASSSMLDFSVTAQSDACFDSTCITIDVRRPASTIGYTIWFIILVWGLALGGLAVLVTTIRRGVEIPLWSYAYLVGVLFALPPLRNSLPASPPAGAFVDFVAFYWATALTGVTLLLLIAIWVRETRPLPPDDRDDDGDQV